MALAPSSPDIRSDLRVRGGEGRGSNRGSRGAAIGPGIKVGRGLWLGVNREASLRQGEGSEWSKVHKVEVIKRAQTTPACFLAPRVVLHSPLSPKLLAPRHGEQRAGRDGQRALVHSQQPLEASVGRGDGTTTASNVLDLWVGG